jgi:hypothetical protein
MTVHSYQIPSDLRPLHRSIVERETLLIPHAYSQHVLGELHYQGATPLEEDEGLTMPNYDPKDNFLPSLTPYTMS